MVELVSSTFLAILLLRIQDASFCVCLVLLFLMTDTLVNLAVKGSVYHSIYLYFPLGSSLIHITSSFSLVEHTFLLF